MHVIYQIQHENYRIRFCADYEGIVLLLHSVAAFGKIGQSKITL